MKRFQLNVLISVLAATLLAGCGQKLEGTYSDPSGMVSYRFQKDGKVYLGTMGVEHELRYELDGDKVRLIAEQGANTILTMDKGGAIIGPMGVKLVKK